jgi:hypothetical protein
MQHRKNRETGKGQEGVMAGKKKKKQPKKKKHPGQPPSSPNVLAWEDDPQGNTPVSVPTPDPAEKPLAFRFPTPAPTAGQYPLGTASFRYWAAVVALRRGANFWSPGIPACGMLQRRKFPHSTSRLAT